MNLREFHRARRRADLRNLAVMILLSLAAWAIVLLMLYGVERLAF